MDVAPVARLFSLIWMIASRDAMSYYSVSAWQARREALGKQCRPISEKVYPPQPSRGHSQPPSLRNVLTEVAVLLPGIEQENVKKASANLRQIENPYTPGIGA